MNDQGEVIKKTTPTGQVTTSTYDYSLSRYYKISQKMLQMAQGDESSLDISRATIFDRYTGLPVYSIDGNGGITKTHYDKVGRRTLVELPDDDDGKWNPLSDENPDFRSNNPKTTIVYNDGDHKIVVEGSLGAVTEYTYNDHGKITEKVQTNRYGSLNDGTSFTGKETIRYRFTYDSYGNIITVEDPRGNIVDYEYDALDNLTRETLPEVGGVRSVRSYRYNYSTRRKDSINENGQRIVENRDAKGNVLRRREYGEGGLVVRTTTFDYDALGNLVREIDGELKEFHFRYDERNQEIERRVPSEVEFHSGKEPYTASQRMLTRYNGDGFKVEEVSYRNTQEVRTVYEVNGLGQIIAAKVAYTDKDGVVLESVKKSVFDGEGNEVLAIDPRGHRTLRRFTARGKIWEETDAPGHSIRYEYDLLDRLISMTDQRGTSGKYPQGDFSIEYVYDDLDRLIIGKLPKHRGLSEKPEVRLVYDLRGNLLKRIEADGGTTTYRYDRRNRLLEETRGSQDSTTTYTTYTDYDPLGNVVKLTEPGGGPVEFLYDSLNRKIRESYPDGGVRYYSYDKNDNLLFEEGPNGFRILYEYNALNQMVKQTDQEKGVSEYRFDEGSNLTWHKDERGVVRTSLYDEVNRILRETDGRGGQTTYRYDLAGNLVERVDPKGTVITSEYSPTNLETRRTYAGGGESWEVSYSYDEAGILKIVKDGTVENRYNYEGSLYTPDPYGLIFSDEQRGAGPARRVSYGYDQKRRLNHVGMPSGEEATYTHNGLDQIVGMPDYITGAITYGQNSYLSGYTFANGVSLNREYDNKRRLTRMEYGLEGEELHRFTFDYDREDNVIQKNSDFFSYDGMNRLLSASLTGKEANMEYAYKGEGETRMVRPDPLGDQVMELAGEDLTLDWGAGSLGIDLGYGYRVIEVVLKPQSLATRLTAETLEVYTALYNKEGYWDEPVEFTFERDETTGEITLNFDEVQFARYLKIHSHFYEMNEAGEALDGDATLELRGGDPFDVSILSSGRNEFYRYDAKGNREEKSHFTKDFVSYTYTYYSGSDWIKTDGRYGYTCDANGNMLERGSAYEAEGDGLTILKEGDYHRYDYDLANRLRAVYRWDEEKGTEVLVKQYTYNAAGYRILAEDALKTQVFYTFDLEGKVIERSDSYGTRNCVFLGSKVIAFMEDEKTYYYGTDHLGSTTLITDASGKTVWSGAVTPFADQESSDDGESVLFTGKELDPDTGLYYFNARWYDAELGRFTTEDPIRDGQNWYAYVGNNPLRFVDSSGLELQLSVDKDSQLMTVTRINGDTVITREIAITTGVVSQNYVPNTDTSRTQNSGSNTTNPTQFPNGTWNVTGAWSNPTEDSRFGETWLFTDATQPLSDVNTGETVDDTGYAVHLTDFSNTNGCIGIFAEDDMEWLINQYQENEALDPNSTTITAFGGQQTATETSSETPAETPQTEGFVK